MNGREISNINIDKLMINYSNFFILPNSSIVLYEIIFSFLEIILFHLFQAQQPQLIFKKPFQNQLSV